MSESWIYHKTEKPKIVDDIELAAYKAQGWAESPADFEKQEEEQEQQEQQEGESDSLNALIDNLKAEDVKNLAHLTKGDICLLAEKKFKVSLSMRKTQKELLEELESLFSLDGVCGD